MPLKTSTKVTFTLARPLSTGLVRIINYPVSNFVNDTIKLTNQLCCLVCGVLTPGKLLPSPKEVVADPLPKHWLFAWWSSPVQLLPSP